MKEEFNLSKKMINNGYWSEEAIEDVKEFIRLFKEELKLQLDEGDLLWCCIRIDKLAGDKLK